jgi:HK97 family phage prohead protease
MMNLRHEHAEEVRHVEFRASDDADGQTLEGYAAVFNEWTDIRDFVGEYRERIMPGAFKRSLGQRTPVLQFDHGTHPLIGSIPLGTLSVTREDRNGLFVRARLSDNWLIQPVRDAVREKAITGMSIRFRVVADQWGTDDGTETRTITEVELLELGPVVFPAYESTSVAVRSLVGALDDETRAVLAQELSHEDTGTPDVASGPAEDDGPDEPPVASHEDNRNRIAAALDRYRQHPNKETITDVA